MIAADTAPIPSAPTRRVIQPIAAPSLRCLPERVNGIPVFLEILDLTAEIPSNLFQENPPLFIETSNIVQSHNTTFDKRGEIPSWEWSQKSVRRSNEVAAPRGVEPLSRP